MNVTPTSSRTSGESDFGTPTRSLQLSNQSRLTIGVLTRELSRQRAAEDRRRQLALLWSIIATFLAITLAACGSSSPVHRSSSPAARSTAHPDETTVVPTTSTSNSDQLGVSNCAESWSSEPLIPCTAVPSVFSADTNITFNDGNDPSDEATSTAQNSGCLSGQADSFVMGGADAQGVGNGAYLVSFAINCSNVHSIASVYQSYTQQLQTIDWNDDTAAVTIGQQSLIAQSSAETTFGTGGTLVAVFVQGHFICIVILGGPNSVVSLLTLIPLAQAQDGQASRTH